MSKGSVGGGEERFTNRISVSQTHDAKITCSVVCPFSNQRDVSYHLHGPREHFRHSAGYVSGVWIKQNRNGSSFFSVRMGIRARSSTGWTACRSFRAQESSPKYCFVLVAHYCRNLHGP